MFTSWYFIVFVLTSESDLYIPYMCKIDNLQFLLNACWETNTFYLQLRKHNEIINFFLLHQVLTSTAVPFNVCFWCDDRLPIVIVFETVFKVGVTYCL